MSISTMSPPTSHQEQDYHSFDSSISMNRRGTMPNLHSLNVISLDSQSSSEAIQRRNSLNNLNILLSKNVKHDQQSQFQIQSTQINHPSSKGNGNAATANLLVQLLSSSQQQQSANRRHSSALSQTKQIRAAQLNLLAQQANLASTGSTNLKTAKAANLVLGTALVVAAQKEKRRQSMGQFRKSNKGLLLQSEDEKLEMEECAISSDSDEDGQPGSSAAGEDRKRYNNEKSRNTSNSFSSFGSYHDLLNSNKTQRTEKVTKEYAEQLAKTFQGDSFLDVAGEVAKDFSSFYKAEREWTGRALRRQSQEEEAAQENKMELDGQIDGGNGYKGKKRELNQLERERGNSDDFEMIRNNNKRQRSMNASNSSPEFYRRVDPNVITSLESSRKSISSLSKVQSPSSTLMNPPISIPSPSSSNSNDGMDHHRPRSNSKISPLSSRNTSPIPPLLSSSTPTISITPASTNTSPIESTSSSRSQNQSLTNISFSNSSLTNLAHRASLNLSPDPMSMSLQPIRSQSFSNNSNGPTKLTSVLSNFATLLESREQSCEGLESLVKNSKSLTPLPNVYQVLEEKKREKYGGNLNGSDIIPLEGDSSLGDSSMESESGEDEVQ